MNARVLVVDDTPQNVKLIGDLLAANGYEVSSAANGEEALVKVATNEPDLVLLDVMMPGMSGYDVCRQLRSAAATALLPIVLVTSLDPQQERIRGIEAGADDFLSKPINKAEMFARVKSLLRIKALQDEVARQAATLRDMNSELEARVSAQVAQLQRLGRLKRFFSPAVVDAIVSAGEQSILAPHRREISYVFADLRGFTAFTDSAEPEEVQGVLHEYHEAMGRIVTEHEATLDRFAGDGILIFVNDPFTVPDPCVRAARMALAMQLRFGALRSRWSKLGFDLDLGIGIAHGFATLGAFGYEERSDYTAVGGVVNLASRLCSEAQSGQILIDRRAWAALDERAEVEPVGSLTLKGFSKPVAAYSLKRMVD